MPLTLYEWLDRIKAVEREHTALRLATDRLLVEAERDPTILSQDVRLADLRQASNRLEGTYLIRLFAEFEAGLRLFWSSARGTDPPSRTRDLIDGLAATRRVTDGERNNVHTVREYRNSLIHEREDALDPIPLAHARAHLCKFFRYLPPTW